MQDANGGAEEGDSGREEERSEYRVEVREVVLGALGPLGVTRSHAQCGPARFVINKCLCSEDRRWEAEEIRIIFLDLILLTPGKGAKSTPTATSK